MELKKPAQTNCHIVSHAVRPEGSDIEVTDSFADDEWRRYVASQPGATPAHLLEWRDLIHDVFGYRPVYLAARSGGDLCGVLPAFRVRSALLGSHLISMPFLNSGGICARDCHAFNALLDGAGRMTRGLRARHLEMRCAYPPPPGVPSREHKVRLLLDLPDDPDVLWSSFRGEIRNRVKHAEKAGLTVEFHSTRLREFYSVFAANMREIGVPVHPMRFFEAVLQTFPERAELVVVCSGSEIIGGAILFAFNDTIEVPWVSSSRAHFSACPNNILYWQMMRRACEDGFATFDFGRSSLGTGPATFKLRWGARASQLYWQYVVNGSERIPGETANTNPRYKLASAVWSRLPQTLTDFLGPRLIAHLPG